MGLWWVLLQAGDTFSRQIVYSTQFIINNISSTLLSALDFYCIFLIIQGKHSMSQKREYLTLKY